MAPRTRRELPRFDFHSHTFLSDGRNSPTDLWHRALRMGHRALAITDHVSLEDVRPLLQRLREESRAFARTKIVPIIGVEISMVPPREIAATARAARQAGAEIVIVHGETLMEPVPPGTNRVAIECDDVDLLAHPGLLTRRDAQRARDTGTVLELSGRWGHSLTNGLVAQRAMEAGAELVVDSDAHNLDDLLTGQQARRIALGAGLSEDRVLQALSSGPRALLKRLGRGRANAS